MIQYNNLSRDKEDDEEFELDDYDDLSDGDCDEIQIVSHFFGSPNESEEELEESESDDPFANLADWVADDEDDGKKDHNDEEEDDEIMILD